MSGTPVETRGDFQIFIDSADQDTQTLVDRHLTNSRVRIDGVLEKQDHLERVHDRRYKTHSFEVAGQEFADSLASPYRDLFDILWTSAKQSKTLVVPETAKIWLLQTLPPSEENDQRPRGPRTVTYEFDNSDSGYLQVVIDAYTASFNVNSGNIRREPPRLDTRLAESFGKLERLPITRAFLASELTRIALRSGLLPSSR